MLPEGYRFTILGYAEHPPEAHTLDAILGDLATVVRSEGPATVIGPSFGGFLAPRFAAEHPDVAEKPVILISAHRFSARGRWTTAGQMASLRDGHLCGPVLDHAALFRRP